MDAFLRDLRHSARALLRTRAFTATAVAALALGIAANTAIFTVIDAVLLKPFAYPDPGRMVLFQNIWQGGHGGTASPSEFNWWRRQTSTFQNVSAYSFDVSNFTGDGLPEQIQTTRVSADFFRLCGANPVYGRTFTAADDLPGASKTALLSYGFWQRRFGGDPGAVGRSIALSGEAYRIIGIANSSLESSQISELMLGSGDIEIEQPPDVFIPFQIDPNSSSHGHFFNVIARLNPGITAAAANARLQAAYADYQHQWPDDFRGRTGFRVEPVQRAITGGVRESLLILLGTVGFVLLIACANVANLLLARATVRSREIAIRAAVGASRIRIVRQLLSESLLLSLAGGGLGLALGNAGIRALLRLHPGGIPRLGPDGSSVGVDWRVFGFTLAVSLLTSVLFGLAPALHASRADLNEALKRGSKGSAGAGHSRTRGVLVAAEMSLALVLLIGAALLIRTFVAIRQVNPGFDAKNILTMRMSLTGPQFAKPADVTRLVHEGLRRIDALPGVETAAATCCIPLEDRLGLSFRIAGRPEGQGAGGAAGWTLVSAGYFEAFRIPLLRGRTFTERDDAGPPVVIVNESVAKQFWPDGDPLNGEILIGNSPPRRIVGVVADVRDNALDRDPRPDLYMPTGQMADTSILRDVPWAWVIRTKADPLSSSAAIQKELREASGGLPVAQIRTMQQAMAASTAGETFSTLVLTIFGCAALLLAAIGIYGVMAYSVAQSSQEIGIRAALGAEAAQIRNMVVLHGMRLALIGVAVGILAAFALTRLLAGFLFGVKPWDPLVFVLTPVVLAGVALAAVWLPARRATRVDPVVALRHD